MALQFTKNALNPSQSVWRASLVACAAAAFSIAAVVACSSNDPTGNPDEGSSGFTPVPAPTLPPTAPGNGPNNNPPPDSGVRVPDTGVQDTSVQDTSMPPRDTGVAPADTGVAPADAGPG